MANSSQEYPFADLPAGLVEEVLEHARAAGNTMLAGIRDTRARREQLRTQLLERRLLQHESELGYPPQPTTCGTDGSYAIERLLTADLAAAAAVAVEGLTPPKEQRFWAEPRHSTFVAVERHASETATILRAVMLGRELLLAAEAPHEVVMLDGTLTLPIIYFNQALNAAPGQSHLACSREFVAHAEEFLVAYKQLLRPMRSDHEVIALPKYSTRRELGDALDWPAEYDDRGLLTLLLAPGELTRPRPIESESWHLNVRSALGSAAAKAVADEIVAALSTVEMLYYRPHPWLPALRVEMARETASNPHRLALVIQGLKHQCATPSMLEPYPVYLADRTVKALARAVPTFRHVATQALAEQYDGEIAEVFFAMHGYRSESGV